jgi:hypothetical protein
MLLAGSLQIIFIDCRHKHLLHDFRIIPHPHFFRTSEANLVFAKSDLLRQHVSHSLPEHSLGDSFRHQEPGGEPDSELHQAMIQERDSTFHTMSHRVAIFEMKQGR